jgi:DNA-directed RNA polymerase alpha subunit
VYNIIEKINDNKRKIDNLNIDVYIKDQLKKHNILYVKDLCEKSRKDLSEYLNEEEINKIIEALKEYELFIKGELEVIKDDDGS